MKIQKATTINHVILTEITKKSKAFWGYSEEQIKKWESNLTVSKEYILKNEVFNLIDDDDEIVGYNSWIKNVDNSVKLDKLFVLPEFIGKGYGKLLMNDFLEKMKHQKIDRITLDAEPNAEKFYQKLGFTKIGEFETSIKNRFMPIMEMKL